MPFRLIPGGGARCPIRLALWRGPGAFPPGGENPTLAADQADRGGMTSPNQEPPWFRNTLRLFVTFLKDTSNRVERNNLWITQTLRC